MATSVFYSIIRNFNYFIPKGCCFFYPVSCVFLLNMGLFITILHIGWKLGKPLVNLESTGYTTVLKML